MKHVAVICGNVSDGTSWYRGAGPIAEMQKDQQRCASFLTDGPGGGVAFHFPDHASWPEMGMVDALILQRPCSAAHYGVAMMAKQMGLPIWSDYDDLVWNLPAWMPDYTARTYVEPTLTLISRTLALSDEVTVTTEALADGVVKYCGVERERVTVVPNALPTWCPPLPADSERSKVILWRGSDSHRGDLESVAEDIAKFSCELQGGWHWVFMGHHPSYLSQRMPAGMWSKVPWAGLPEYWGVLQSVRPQVCIVPLVDHPFNLAKSNIAYLESLALGAVTVCRDWPEWTDRPGVVNYGETVGRSFLEALEIALATSERPSLDGLPLLRSVNALRWSVLNRMLARGPSWAATGKAKHLELIAAVG